MEVDESSSKGGKLGIAAPYFKILQTLSYTIFRWIGTYSSPDGINNVAPTTLMALAGVCDDNLKIVIFTKYLFDTTVIAAFLSWLILL